MDEAIRLDAAEPAADGRVDPATLIASLRAAGAGTLAPVRLRHVEALALRASSHRGEIRRMLDARLARAVGALREQLAGAQREMQEAVARAIQSHPQAAGELQRLSEAADLKGVRRRIDRLRAEEHGKALGQLVRRLEQSSNEQSTLRPAADMAPRAELKAVRESRNTWAKLSAGKQVAQALEQAPKNAGPINSHMLMLRSLALMREISPDYLNRFISYADTLLCLDQREKDQMGKAEKPKKVKKPQGAKPAKK
ncbi:Protein of unknown function [Noviherbaspirillum humi]|uniref:DUF2894 domain-containing protein n=1 Tax=Noviherbaspirillum humi TaxID=1688639 RepID=A0A239M085_9BURK|nr:DUF2894 domain-containing protein [Noviherbaspirillum humi]SNT35473.1 Protein of unknown function [Noviherbaspirillum humi]